MKNLSRTFNRPSDEQFEFLWKNAIISFDANVLLNVYQFGEQSRHTFIGLLKQLSDRLWLTHQAAFEYNKNRRSRMDAQESAFNNPFILTELSSIYNKIKNLHHPAIDYAELAGELNKLIAGLKTHTSSSNAMSDYQDLCDAMHTDIVSIFDEKIGKPYEPDVLAEKRLLAEKRYANLIPPGFKDLTTKKNAKDKEYQDPSGILLPDPFGDAIMWFQLLDYAKNQDDATRKPVIFVTDDAKVDWWWIEKGKTLGPRPELIAEMQVVGKSVFYMYDSQSFMKHAATHVAEPPKKEDLDSALSEAERLIRILKDDATETNKSSQLFKFGGVNGKRIGYMRPKKNHTLHFAPLVEEILNQVSEELQHEIVRHAFKIADEPVSDSAGVDIGKLITTPHAITIRYTQSDGIATIHDVDFLIPRDE